MDFEKEQLGEWVSPLFLWGKWQDKKTIVAYNGTDSSQARKIADLLGVGTVKKNDGTYSFTGDYLVVVGQDWK